MIRKLALFSLFAACAPAPMSDRAIGKSVPASGETAAPADPSAPPAIGAEPRISDADGPMVGDSGAQAGLLTAGAWDDNLNFMFFRDYLKLRKTSGTLAINRDEALRIEVKDAAGKPLPGATVRLFADQEKKIELTTGGEGRALFFPTWDGAAANAQLSVEALLDGHTITQAITSADFMKADAKVTLTVPDTAAVAPASLDLAFLIDTTGSMGDELSYLQTEVDDLASRVAERYPNISIRYALVLYKDQGDQYITRVFDFGTLAELKTHLEAQSAGGGGNWPEAVHKGLDELVKLSWQSSARVTFWTADAPYHFGVEPTVIGSLKKARELGVHLYPIAASGVDDLAEAMLRDAAQVTSGRYLFLTDDSGIGDPHAEPHIPCYYVTRLDQAMERMIRIELTGIYEEPSEAEIIRTGGKMSTGQCQLTTGAVVTAY